MQKVQHKDGDPLNNEISNLEIVGNEEKNTAIPPTETGEVALDAVELRGLNPLVHDQPWFVVENGSQLDIHARVFPPNESLREITVASNILRLEVADEICAAHNAALAEAV